MFWGIVSVVKQNKKITKTNYNNNSKNKGFNIPWKKKEKYELI
jgi:hypothetical protein